MADFCTNCGTEIRKGDNFCTNCGIKIRKEDSFCTNCGVKLKGEGNFCFNCGAKIDKSYIKHDKPLSKSVHDSTEKKIDIIAKEKVNKEQNKARIKKEREIHSIKIEKNEAVHGGYCDLNCRHCYEEFMDEWGGIVGDFDSEGYVEYYCYLGHPLSFGSFCKDYE